MVEERTASLGTHGQILAVIAEPDGSDKTPARTAMLIVNAGTVHRVGPSRLHVRLARRLARRGLPAVRFDLPGLGDSSLLPAEQGMSFIDRAVLAVQQVMNDLERLENWSSFIVAGLCSGAVVAAETALADTRVKGVVPVDLPLDVIEEDSRVVKQYSARHFAGRIWKTSILDRRKWGRLLTGRYFNRRFFSDLFLNTSRALTFRAPRAGRRRSPGGQDDYFLESDVGISDISRLLDEQRLRYLLVFTSDASSLEYVKETLRNRCIEPTNGRVALHVVEGARHCFERVCHQLELADRIIDWVQRAAADCRCGRNGIIR